MHWMHPLRFETLKPIDIVGRRQKPLVTVDVARVPMESTLSRLKQPFIDRIAKAGEKEPF